MSKRMGLFVGQTAILVGFFAGNTLLIMAGAIVIVMELKDVVKDEGKWPDDY